MIITNPAQLKLPCSDSSIEESISIIELLEQEFVKHDNAVGLAAPQIGIQKKVAIIRICNNWINLVNPIIINKYALQPNKNEGCLSFPNQFFNTKRYKEIQIINQIKPYNFIAIDFLAIVCQHEIDHLNGIILSDII